MAILWCLASLLSRKDPRVTSSPTEEMGVVFFLAPAPPSMLITHPNYHVLLVEIRAKQVLHLQSR